MMSRLPSDNLKKNILFLSNYLPLQIWTLNQDISKSIIARSFKHGELIEDDE